MSVVWGMFGVVVYMGMCSEILLFKEIGLKVFCVLKGNI